MKRLFLFAAYDRDGIVDDTLTYYLGELSKLGDLVVVMDNDATDNELAKIKSIPNVLYAAATRHGEYDFGSYKRAYQYARDNKILENYDWIYLVNDSVLGPLYDITPILNDLESRGVDLTGMISYSEKYVPEHVQSWFVGITQRVATADFFNDFLSGVKYEQGKATICCKYEFQLSIRILRHGFKMSTYLKPSDFDGRKCHYMYHEPLKTLKLGMPFIKKTVAHRVLGQHFVLQYPDNNNLIDMFNKWATRIFGVFPDNKPIWKPYFRLRLFGLQILKIYKSENTFGGASEEKYRLEFLGFIPLGFIHLTGASK